MDLGVELEYRKISKAWSNEIGVVVQARKISHFQLEK